MTVYKFPATSRYYGIATATFTAPDGRQFVFRRRRFLPAASRFALLQEHVVQEGERPDTLAAKFLGDPQAFWRLADANEAMRPEELVKAVGRRLRITLPEGIP